MKVWIDLDNSPHVPFFVPIIEELEAQGHTIMLTARDCFQVCELADLHNLSYERIGRHFGKNKILKFAGLTTRGLQLVPTVRSQRPDLAVSHGSRAQLLVSRLLGISSIVIIDYEHAKGLAAMRPSWVMAPEVIPKGAIHFDERRTLRYPGIKEDVYVPRFRPDPSIVAQLGLRESELLVTVRPPATEAHYHSRESETLFRAAIEFLADQTFTRLLLLPRNHRQETALRSSWPDLFASGKLFVPAKAVDGLNLIWHSDLVISGGGTMNREAAALGVPVYSVFRGEIGAVDRYLAANGRLILLETADEVRSKIALQRRARPSTPENMERPALTKIIHHLSRILQPACSLPQYDLQRP